MEGTRKLAARSGATGKNFLVPSIKKHLSLKGWVKKPYHGVATLARSAATRCTLLLVDRAFCLQRKQ